jgi:hypothetical protein
MTEDDLREALREQAIRRVENQTHYPSLSFPYSSTPPPIPRNPFYPSYPMDEYPSVAAEGRAEDFMGTIEQGPTGFMADYIRPMMDSLEQKHGGGSPESGVSTADLINLGMLGMGMGSRVSGSSPKGAKPSKPEPRRTRVVQEGKKTKPKETKPSDADRRGGVGPDWERLPDGRPANGNVQSVTGIANGHTKRVPGMEVERRAALQEYMERLMAGMGKYFPPGQ